MQTEHDNATLIPEELRLSKDGQTLSVHFADAVYHLSAEYLRVCSPSAEVRGHGQAPWQTVGGKQGISIYRLAPVGNYAVQIIFSDGHASGIYSWAVLHDLACQQEHYWARYLEALAQEGKTRVPHQNRRIVHVQRVGKQLVVTEKSYGKKEQS